MSSQIEQIFSEFWKRSQFSGSECAKTNDLANLTKIIGPRKVLDLGCGPGFLVTELNGLGFDALGIDITSVPFLDNPFANKRLIKGDIFKLADLFGHDSFGCVTAFYTLQCLDEDEIRDTLRGIKEINSDLLVVKNGNNSIFSEVSKNLKPRLWWDELFSEYGFIRAPFHFHFNNPLGTGNDDLDFFGVYKKYNLSQPYELTEHYLMNFVSSYVRPNDNVLLAGLWMDYSCKVVEDLSDARLVTRDFHKLKSFELIVLNEDTSGLDFSEIVSKLMPTGRLICVNPIHPHKISLSDQELLLDEHFIIEKTGSGSISIKSFENSHTSAFDQSIKIFMKMSVNGAAFRDTVYTYATPPKNLLAFARDYQNPWIVREICEKDFRLRSPKNLVARSLYILGISPMSSADYGAALCILGYRLLEQPKTSLLTFQDFETKVTEFCNLPTLNAHHHRWKVSCAFVQGQILLKLGHQLQARQYFDLVINLGFENFGPTLSTKIVSAYKLRGMIDLMQQGPENCKEDFSRAGICALSAFCLESSEWIGNLDQPLTCNYFDAVGLLDDGFHAFFVSSGIYNSHSKRYKFSSYLPQSLYRKPLMDSLRFNEQQLKNLENLLKDRDDLIEELATEIQSKSKKSWLVLSDFENRGLRDLAKILIFVSFVMMRQTYLKLNSLFKRGQLPD